MCRLLLINFFVLLFLAGPAKAAGQSTELAQLQGVTPNHTLALLQSKMLRGMVNQPSAEGSLLVDATYGMFEREGKTIKYYGALEVEAFRLVAIKKTEQIVWAPVWDGHIYSRACPIKLLLRSRRP